MILQHITFFIFMFIPDTVFSPLHTISLPEPTIQFFPITKTIHYVSIGYPKVLTLMVGKTFKTGIRKMYTHSYNWSGELSLIHLGRYFDLSLHLKSFSKKLNDIYAYSHDTVVFKAQYMRAIFDISVLPVIFYIRQNFLSYGLPFQLSLFYPDYKGRAFFIGLEYIYPVNQGIYHAGIGLLSPKKMVILGINSKLLPEFQLKLLTVYNFYLQILAEYSIFVPEIEKAYEIDSIFYIFKGRGLLYGYHISVFIERCNLFRLYVSYMQPDSLFPEYVSFNFSAGFGKNMLLKSAILYMLSPEVREDKTFWFENRIEMLYNLKVYKGVFIRPEINIVGFTREIKQAGLNIGFMFRYRNLRFDAGVDNLLSKGNLEDVYSKRRFKIGGEIRF